MDIQGLYKKETLIHLIDSIRGFNTSAETEHLKYNHIDKTIMHKDETNPLDIPIILMDEDQQKQIIEWLDDLHRILCMKPWETLEDAIPFIGKVIQQKGGGDVSIIIGASIENDKLVIRTGMGKLVYSSILFHEYEFVNKCHPIFIPSRYDNSTIGKNI